MEALTKDLDDLEHDDGKAVKDGKEPARLKDCTTGCSANTWHDWDGKRSETICSKCTKRSIDPRTHALFGIHQLAIGGYPLHGGDLPHDVWLCLAKLKQRDAATLAACGMLR